MPVICFTGFSKSGKDACAQILEKELGWPKFSFADKLKLDLARLLNIDVSLLHSAKKDEFIYIDGIPINLRKAMRDLSLVYKNQDPAFYAKIVEYKLRFWPKAIISDLRFKIEEEHLKQFGHDLFIIMVTNPNVTPDWDAISEKEHLQIKPNIVIENNGTLEELTEKVKLIAKSFINKE